VTYNLYMLILFPGNIMVLSDRIELKNANHTNGFTIHVYSIKFYSFPDW